VGGGGSAGGSMPPRSALSRHNWAWWAHVACAALRLKHVQRGIIWPWLAWRPTGNAVARGI
jgi:hypothetical protein